MKMDEVVDDFPTEDSPNLTDEEIAESLLVTSVSESAGILSKTVAEGSLSVEGHELLRRGDHLFWRVSLKDVEGRVRTLIFQADWLGT